MIIYLSFGERDEDMIDHRSNIQVEIKFITKTYS